MTTPAPVSTHPAFEWLRSVPVRTLGIEVSEYRHRKTGAMHFHLAADNDENVFLVALRTVPGDSTGVAHILEHTALCGSQRYPVRDPFFMMVRRSLNTFMNAFTSSDWTAYPFASRNAKDFDNLLSVYLDAVFFCKLDPLDFAQEGHRLEFAEPDNPDSELVYKGVVYNEMKGAMSSPVSQLYQTLCKHLFPTSTYHHNSGGDPDCIPDLTHEDLREFHRTHYHPSNAIFMTYGNRPAASLQEAFETAALTRFDALPLDIRVHPEKRYFSPIRVEEAYPRDLQEGETPEQAERENSHVVIGWLLGDSTSLQDNLEAQLLSDVLLENSASPLRHLLETCGLGDAPSPLCGLEDSNRELSFMCGLENTSPEHVATLEKRVFDVLETVARDGVPQERLEALLHQLELSQREIGGDGYPYGLQLILSSLPPAIHRGDAIAALDVDAALEGLRTSIRDPGFIPALTRRLLLDNPHRVTLTLRPDQQLEARRDAALRDALRQRRDAMDETEKQRLVEQARTLQARQSEAPDASVLPKVGLEDVPAHTPMPATHYRSSPYGQVASCIAGTNGLVYHQILCPIGNIPEEDLHHIPLLSGLVGELGAGGDDYLALQNRISAVSGGIGAISLMRSALDDVQDVRGFFGVSGKALVRHQRPLAELLQQVFRTCRFDEWTRIRELIGQYRSRMEQGITHNGHGLAMSAACAGMNPSARAAHLSGGLEGIRRLQALDDRLTDDSGVAQLAARLEDLHTQLLSGPRHFLLIGEQEAVAAGHEALDAVWTSTTPAESGCLALPPVSRRVREAWLTNTQVNFCAMAFPTVPGNHPDAAVLAVLGAFLRNGFLHRAIREQGGAYGGGASQDSNTGAFRFYSYRDPRLAATLADFEASLEWLQASTHGYEPLEEAILGVIGTLDKPGSPSGEAKQAFQNRLFGRDDAFYARHRARILATTVTDLQRCASQWLKPEKASVAVVTSRSQWESTPLPEMDVITV